MAANCVWLRGVRVDSRDLVWINVQPTTEEWIARQITEAIPWGGRCSALHDRDRDRILCAVGSTPMRARGAIRDKPIAQPHLEEGFAERLIGSIRRECLDHFLFWARHIAPNLKIYARTTMVRTHRYSK